jgi:hypothetical protein
MRSWQGPLALAPDASPLCAVAVPLDTFGEVYFLAGKLPLLEFSFSWPD